MKQKRERKMSCSNSGAGLVGENSGERNWRRSSSTSEGDYDDRTGALIAVSCFPVSTDNQLKKSR